jgi:Skp family chaperone for outer membrane proteins
MHSTVLRLLASLIMAALAGVAAAQQDIESLPFEVPTNQIATSILTVDIERLLSQSLFGQRLAQTHANQSEALGLEHRRIAEDLRAEELALTVQRSVMAADVFRSEAEAFDEKAQDIRRAQDAKVRELELSLVQGRDQFLEVTRPILGQLMMDRGAYAILDRRSVLLSLGSIDVTDDAIARIDAAIGDGAVAAPETSPDVVPD